MGVKILGTAFLLCGVGSSLAQTTSYAPFPIGETIQTKLWLVGWMQ